MKIWIFPLLILCCLCLFSNVAFSEVDQLNIWENNEVITSGLISNLAEQVGLGSNNRLFHSIDEISVRTHISSDWNCEFIFLLDRTKDQITIFHSEGNGEEPSELGSNDACISMIEATDFIPVAQLGEKNKNYANQPVIWYSYVTDRYSGKVFCYIFSTHRYDVRGHRISPTGHWYETGIGNGIFSSPGSISSFSPVWDSNNALVIADLDENKVFIVDFGNNLLGTLDNSDFGFDNTEIKNVSSCFKEGKFFIAVNVQVGLGEEVLIFSSNDRGFSSPVLEERLEIPQVVDMAFDPYDGLWVLDEEGRATVWGMDGLIEKNIHFSDNISNAPICLDVENGCIFPVSFYSDYSGIERYRPSSSFHLEAEKTAFFIDVEQVSCQYGIQEPGNYALRLRCITSQGVVWHQISGCDFTPGTHQFGYDVNVPQLENQKGKFFLYQFVDGQISRQLESEEFFIHGGPIGGIIYPEESITFGGNNTSTRVIFWVNYGQGHMDNAQIRLVDGVMGGLVSQMQIESPSNSENTIPHFILPENDSCIADPYKFILRINYKINGVDFFRETSGVDILVKKRDCGDGINYHPQEYYPGMGMELSSKAAPDSNNVVVPLLKEFHYSSGILRFSFYQEQQGKIAVYDLRGRLVETIGRLGADVRDVQKQLNLPSGVYFVRFDLRGQSVFTKKIAVVH